MRRALFLLLAMSLVAGCGGSVGEPLTKQEYAAKADAICAKYNREVKKLDNPTNLAELAAVADQTLPFLDGAMNDLRKLNPSASERAKVDQWLSQVEKLKDDLTEIRDRAKDKNMQAVQAVVPKAEEHNRRSNALATELGMTVCNSD